MHSQNPPPPLGHSVEQVEDIIEEILSRLPAKSLLKFRCVSKSWRHLIESEIFVKIHLQNSTKNTAFPHHMVILNHHGLKQCSLRSLLNDQSTDVHSFENPMERDRVVGCCNGLVCILKRPRGFLLWNPTTRISNELPKIDDEDDLDSRVTKFGFGWDESSNAYKVFAVMFSRKGKLCKVYSSKTNSWKALERVDFRCIHREGKFVSGKLHWCRLKRDDHGGRDVADIVTFDLKTEKFRTMEQPCDPKALFGHRVSLGVLGGCLSLHYAYEKCLDVWIMKEYGVKESWLKVTSYPLVYEPIGSLPFVVVPLWIGVNGEILLMVCYTEKENVFVLKQIKGVLESHLCIKTLVKLATNKEKAVLGKIKGPLEAHVYVESLVNASISPRGSNPMRFGYI